VRINTTEEYFEYVRRLGAIKLRLALKQADGDVQAAAADLFSEGETDGGAEGAGRGERAAAAAAEGDLRARSAGLLEESGFFAPEYLFQLFGLSDFERHCVLMALCYEIDAVFAAGFALLREEGQSEGLTPHIACLTWPGDLDGVDVFQTFHRTSVLMSVFFRRPALNGCSEIGKQLRLAERVLDFFFGRLGEDEKLKAFAPRYEPEQGEEQGTLSQGQPDAAAFLTDGEPAVAELTGEPGTGKKYCVQYYCRQAGRMAYFIPVDRRLMEAEAGEDIFCEILRECRLFQAVPALILQEEGDGDDLGAAEGEMPGGPGARLLQAALRLAELLLEASDVVFLLDRRPVPEQRWRGAARWLHFDVKDMSLVEKRAVWKQEAEGYPLTAGLQAEEMANLFPLTRGGIRAALKNADWLARRQGRNEIGREDLRKGCYQLFHMDLQNKAVKIPAVYVWEDLILPPWQKELLTAACDQVRYRHLVYESWGFSEKMAYGRGVSMIFAGPPGTGKTMAAQVFAGELGIDLYKIELSAVVSKFVGETEKNLNRIFEQARKSRVILFFDEADVLFGKRTEVKDSNDKYSNMEAAFLLQKMEEYEGVTILATNLLQNFDEAFKRRVKFVIDFPFPGPEERRLLWRKAMPGELKREELDVAYLAQNFELSGSNIKNAALHAAFLAAAEGTAVNMAHVLRGVRNEYAKGGKVLTKKDLGEYYVLLPELGS